MADTARGLVSMTPVVTIAADSDADAVDAIHHDIKATLGGKLEYEKADANDKWVYSASRDITGTSADVIASGTSFTEGGTTVVGDHLKYLFLKNSGTTDGSTSTSIIINYFRSLGIELEYHIPNRFTEGYGPSKEVFSKFKL